MTQLTVFKENGALSLRASQQSPDIGGTISNIVFGVCACAIGGVTIWQGYKAWTIWRVHGALSSGSTGRTLDSPYLYTLANPFLDKQSLECTP